MGQILELQKWFQMIPNPNKILKLLCGCRRGWASPSKIPTYIKRCAIEFLSFDINVVTECGRGKGVSNEKRPKIENYVGWNCVGWGEIKSVPLILYIKMTSVIRWTQGDFENEKPTQIQKLSLNFKFEFPGNWTKTDRKNDSNWQWIKNESKVRLTKKIQKWVGWPLLTTT